MWINSLFVARLPYKNVKYFGNYLTLDIHHLWVWGILKAYPEESMPMKM